MNQQKNNLNNEPRLTSGEEGSELRFKRRRDSTVSNSGKEEEESY
jgi:hypothetical protein